MDTFAGLWDEHVDFGTSRSHKKLVGKKRGEGTEWRKAMDAKEKAVREAQQASQQGSSASAAAAIEDDGKPRKRQKQQQQKAQASAAAGAQQKRALPNTGRFGGTLAAKLLGLA